MSTHPRCQFVPPFLVDRVATGTLEIDDEIRAHRESLRATRRGPGGPPAGVSSAATWSVHTAEHLRKLPGPLVRAAGAPASGDASVDDAYTHTEETLDFYATVFSRSSFDGQGSPVTVSVHYARQYDNAFWNGSQLVFGDGDGIVFEPFTKPIDVLAHEFTHGVTEHSAALSYHDQPGALNESVSDAFGIMVKQRVLNQTVEQSDWLIGEGIFTPSVHGQALRSMKAPGTAYDEPRLGKDPQVATMADYVHTSSDSGGVHTNSGIPNHAFYLAASAVGGYSWERVGKVWYAALTGGQVTASTDFALFAQATVDAAGSLFGATDTTVAAIADAWREVGVLSTGDRPGSTGPAPDSGSTRVVRVRRTGGFAGRTLEGSIDLDMHPRAGDVRELLDRIDVTALPAGDPQPDRFSYEFDLLGRQVTVAEQDLTDDLERLATLVLA